MVNLFNARVRNVGTSLGILIPKEVIKEEKITEGEEIEVSVLKKNLALIKDSFGIAKGTSMFKREHRDRLNVN